MNEEQRVVLATVHRLEERRGGTIDEYSVGRGAGILETEISGQDYVASAQRQQIRRLFDELESLGFIRLDRTGYWRPRTTLLGRRELTSPRRRPAPTPTALAPDRYEPPHETRDPETEEPVAAWPVWWPAPLRLGSNPSVAPLVTVIGTVALVTLAFLLFLAIRPKGTSTANPTVLAAATLAVGGPAPTPMSPPTPNFAATPMTTAALARPTPTIRVTATLIPLAPTATPRPDGPALRVANTDNKGAYLFATPNGERRFAISEGTLLVDVGPDQKDTAGRDWKHVRVPDYNDTIAWILAEYTVPAQP